MLIYNTAELDNALIRQEADDAKAAGVIVQGTAERIKAAHPYTLYSPNIFVRIGLGLATVLCVLLATGLFFLLMMDGAIRSIEIFFLVWGVLAYGTLEMWMSGHRHYRSGVDDGLTWVSAVYIAGALVALMENDSPVLLFILLTALASWYTVRTSDPGIALCGWVCGIMIVVYGAIAYIPGARYLLPFLVMGISAGAYLLFTRIQRNFRFRHYDLCLDVLRLGTLATLYLAGNYYVVHIAGMELLGMEGEPPLPWLFWTLSIAIPPVYIWMGLLRKDRIPLAMGLILIAMAVFTIRAYHAVMPIETAMVLGGIFLVGVSYFVHRYLKKPKHGFTTEAMHTRSFGAQQLEGLIIAETMQPTPQAGEAFQFGGGSGGGGGASNEF
ncbi:hypothetical protein [Chitinophaga rhizosphaerae]|uniref:hypothetical protein n=1 Tax=Chitinophaga rhizosphaerae TaxID=1864947 RepID=UPI000F80D75F|nr:hypothetical protein [Chitinophaga rhizosphaerae]